MKPEAPVNPTDCRYDEYMLTTTIMIMIIIIFHLRKVWKHIENAN
jgi:hypothetical protein